MASTHEPGPPGGEVMRSITPGSLLIALVLSAPALWQAWSDPSVDISGALMRFLLAVLLASVGLNMLRTVVKSYQRGVGRPKRRVTDLSRSDRD
jgi:hypothetical protein